ncbi:hypothetical protein BDQ12DRAFT_610112 [Crucibulum laeve]|uniref:SMAD/FHA domain-containing protein n=1 Tax=Crucibulum laeve TaxID=68775 RepID=A0A5C3LSM1_9AGAR|nr:hypothetical protein BDQ12DRAFT_610112 [Crucibulum laeve]
MEPVNHIVSESPPSRTTILGSFLRGRPRNSSQSHTHLNTDHHHPLREPSPPQPPSPNATSLASRRRTIIPATPGAVQQSTSQQTTNTSSGLGISHMLRRRRSAGNVAVPSTTAQAIPPTPSSATAIALALGTMPASAPTARHQPPVPPLAVGGASHRIRLVPHLDSRRSLRFDPIGRDLKEGDSPLRIGRFTDRSGLGLAAVNALGSNKLAFKSKVVSRAHAEIWVESGGRLFIKDTKSSSGTFLNHVRLSPANTESRPYQIKDGDILQLGVDYQGGAEDIYKSVKIRIELGREWQSAANAFNTNALKNLKSLVAPEGAPSKSTGKTPIAGKNQIPDCCICLFSVTIRQALFIAPCSHTFHYKCIRPLLESHHPAFSCPLCRTFADLEEDVEVELELDAESEPEEEPIARLGQGADSELDCPDLDDDADAVGEMLHRTAVREREREAGAETDVEGEGPGGGHLGVRRRAQNSTRQTRGSPFSDGALEEEDDDDERDDVVMVDANDLRPQSQGGGSPDIVIVGSGGEGSNGSREVVHVNGTAHGMVFPDAGSHGPSHGEMGEIDDDVDIDGTVGGKRKR